MINSSYNFPDGKVWVFCPLMYMRIDNGSEATGGLSRVIIHITGLDGHYLHTEGLLCNNLALNFTRSNPFKQRIPFFIINPGQYPWNFSQQQAALTKIGR